MKTSVRFALVAAGVFVLVAGVGAAVLPPDPVSTLPVTVAASLVCWPGAYWLTHRRATDDRT